MFSVKVTSFQNSSLNIVSPQLPTAATADAWRTELLTRLTAEGWVEHNHTMYMDNRVMVQKTKWLKSRDGKHQLDLTIEERGGVVQTPIEAVAQIAAALTKR